MLLGGLQSAPALIRCSAEWRVLACRSGLVATGPFLPGRMRKQPRSLGFTAVAFLVGLLIAGMAAFATPSFASVTQQQKITAPSDADGPTTDFGQTIAGSLDEGPGPTEAGRFPVKSRLQWAFLRNSSIPHLE